MKFENGVPKLEKEKGENSYNNRGIDKLNEDEERSRIYAIKLYEENGLDSAYGYIDEMEEENDARIDREKEDMRVRGSAKSFDEIDHPLHRQSDFLLGLRAEIQDLEKQKK